MSITRINSLGITDGTIVNADINASAAIDASKLTGLSSDYVLLASTDASSSASVSFDGYFSSTYRNYKLILSDILSSTSLLIQIRFRRSNADVTGSNYSKAGNQQYVTSGSSATGLKVQHNNNSINLIENTIRSNSAQGLSGIIDIFNPLSTTTYKRAYLVAGYSSDDAGGTGGTGFFKEEMFTTLQDATTALSGISVIASTGNMTSGNFKLYGVK